MNTASKNKNACDVLCRNHTARAERDTYRICPSKITKRELEDLYYALLESNVELKKAMHAEQDRVKVLSAKVQRMTAAQKSAVYKDKECASMVVINEQKELISDLKKSNDRMADRIRLLNMRLCSAKQFLKRSPTQNTKCPRCATVLTTFRNSSMSALNIRHSDVNVKTAALSYRHAKKDVSPTSARNIETQTELEINASGKQCNENKCRTQMDEIKEKAFNLQEELKTTHTEYSKRITKFEKEITELREENLRVKSANVTREHEIVSRDKTVKELRDRLRESETKYNDIQLELIIEKRRVVELETSLRLATASSEMAKTIEKLTSVTESKKELDITTPRNNSICSNCLREFDSSNIPKTERLSPLNKRPQTREPTFIDKENSVSENNYQAMLKLNQEMLKKIFELQAQLDHLRIKTAGEAVENKYELNHAETMSTESFKNQVNKENSSHKKSNPSDLRNQQDKIDIVNKSQISDSITTLTLIEQKTNKMTKTLKNSKEKNTSVEDTSVKIGEKVNDGIDAKRNETDITSSISESNIKVNELTPDKSNSKVKNNEKLAIAESSVTTKIETGVNRQSSLNKTVESKTDQSQELVILETVNSREIFLKRTGEVTEDDNKTKNNSDNKIKEATALIVRNEGQKSSKQSKQGQRRDSATYTKSKSKSNANTYTKHKEASSDDDVTAPHTYTLERVTSPENTDHEISSLSDLPAEKLKSPRDALSPGEQKSTVIQSETETSHTDYGSLSEGELPDTSRVRRLSTGERPSSHQNWQHGSAGGDLVVFRDPYPKGKTEAYY